MKARYDVVPVDERPVRLVSSIKQCDEGRFPNLLLLLKIDCTLPVTSCECERSFFVLRRLKTWLSFSITMKRLAALAVMKIHYCKEVDHKEVFRIFLALHPIKYNCRNLVFEIDELIFTF